MGMYSRNIYSDGAISELLENCEAIEPRTDYFAEAALNIVVEGEENYNRIMQAVGIDEYNYFEENGVEMVYEAADIKGFFGKIKAFFVNLLQKIKGLIKKFISLFDSYTKSDKDFVNKYRKHLLTVNMKDFEYKGYKFDDAKLTGFNCDKVLDAIRASVNGLGKDVKYAEQNKDKCQDFLDKTSDISDIEETMRGAAFSACDGTDSKMDAGEYSKELFKLYRDGEDSKVVLENISISTQLNYILNTKDAVKKGNDAEKTFTKSTNDILKKIDKEASALAKTVPNGKDADGNDLDSELQSKRVQATNRYYSLLKSAQGMVTTAIGAYLTALKDRNRQAKSICVSAMNYKPKNESTDLGGYSEGASLLDNVVIR